jgi:hypothetical protein
VRHPSHLDNSGDKGGHHKLAELLTEEREEHPLLYFQGLVDVCEEVQAAGENLPRRFVWELATEI